MRMYGKDHSNSGRGSEDGDLRASTGSCLQHQSRQASSVSGLETHPPGTKNNSSGEVRAGAVALHDPKPGAPLDK